MPTYREDLHLGHAVPTTDTADIVDGAITADKMADNSVIERTIENGAVTEPKLANDAVSTRTIQNRAVTEPKLADNAVSTRTIQNQAVTYAKLNEDVRRVLRDLQNQINSFEAHGISVSNYFGQMTDIGISQKTLTEAVNNIYGLLEEALDRTIKGFTWTVTPTYIFGQGETEITVTAEPTEDGGILEHVVLMVDGEVVDDDDFGVTSYEYTFTTDRPVEVKMIAQVLGMEYIRSVNITDSFWMGGGATYNDVFMDGAATNLVNVGKGMRVAQNITIPTGGGYIFIIIGNYLSDTFVRADINGVEIPFLPADTTTLEGFTIYKSENTYNAGTYNIDING